MKNLLIFCLSLIFSIFTCVSQNKDTESFRCQFVVKNNPEKVSDNTYDGVFNLYTVSTVKKIKRWNKKDWMAEYSSNIKEMVILNSIPMPKNMVDNIVNDVLMFCKENEYENVIKDDTNLFYKLNSEKVTGLIIISIVAFTEDVQKIEVRCVNGSFSYESVRAIAAKHGGGIKKFFRDMN